jgi:hypothetical protein
LKISYLSILSSCFASGLKKIKNKTISSYKNINNPRAEMLSISPMIGPGSERLVLPREIRLSRIL